MPNFVYKVRSVTVRKRVNSCVKTLSGTKPSIFLGNVAPGVTEVGCLFLRLRASIWESCQQKVHRTIARARSALQIAKNWLDRGTFGRWGQQNVHDSEQCGKSTLLTLREYWLIWCSAPAICRFSAVCDTLAQLRAAKHEFCCDAPALRDCSWGPAGGCQTHCNSPLLCFAELQLDVAKCTVTAARREELGCLQKS